MLNSEPRFTTDFSALDDPTVAVSTVLSQEDYRRLSNLRYQLRRFFRVSEEICRANGLTSLQYQLLLHVKGMSGKDWASVGELAEKLQAKHHGVVALLDRCEKLGLIERRINQIDRRQIEVHLLPKGAQLVELIAILHHPERFMLENALGSQKVD